LEGSEHRKKAKSQHMYKINQEIAVLDRVALEVGWVGTMAPHFGYISFVSR